jgi:hypothetical protein
MKKGFLNNIPNPGGAVVVEKIVFVIPVFFLIVFLEQVKKSLFLLLIQVQNLFLHRSPVLQVPKFKTAVAFNVEVVQQFTLAEFKQEIGLFEIEGAVIITPVKAGKWIFYTDGAMAKCAIDKFAWNNRHKTDPGRIRKGLSSAQKGHQQEDKEAALHEWLDLGTKIGFTIILKAPRSLKPHTSPKLLKLR